jgi:DnaD/phage-associated family protein
MARKRDIKPGFFKNEDLGELTPLARLFFAGLWCWADRDGRLQDRPKKLKADILAYDNCDGEELVQQLADKKFITRYQSDGERYIQINNWKKHQSPHPAEAKSTIPTIATVLQGSSNVVAGCLQPSTQVEVTDLQGSSNPVPSFTSIPSCVNSSSPAREDEPVDNPEQIKTETLKVVVKEYENEIGILTPTISAELVDMVDNFPRDWVIDAIKGASKQNKRKISYVRGTLNNWQVSGKTLDPPLKKGSVVQLSDADRAKKFAKADCNKCHGTGYEQFYINEEDKAFIPEDQWVTKRKCLCWSSADKFG